MQNTINWFELFVTELPRAQAFYEKVLATTLRPEDSNGEAQAIFGADGVAGALVQRKGMKPGGGGTLVYLNCNGALDAVMARVEKAGGKIVMPKTDIGPPGFIAVMVDTEGNSVGLHSERQ